MRTREFLSRYRAAFVALAVSAAVHAAVFVSSAFHADVPDEASDGPGFTATLEAVTTEPAAIPVPAQAHRATHHSHPRPRPKPGPVEVPGARAALEPGTLVPQMDVPAIDVPPPPTPQPDVVAMAQPAVPVPALAPPAFPVEALPANLTISYKLTSAFADGVAKYTWARDGDKYTIEGEAQAEGFFTLFLEGRLLQEASGVVTATGLKPDHFSEHKPNQPAEGVQFDWATRKVTLDRGDKQKTEDITGNTMDWLSMIFQMASVPPTGDSYDLRVYTQRRYYEFHLIVIGPEEIEIPMGKVRTLHMRHVDPKDGEIVDVWLGIDQHYLPVKLRYPVARNRLMVEQSATSVSE
jgi:hypothetical protein